MERKSVVPKEVMDAYLRVIGVLPAQPYSDPLTDLARANQTTQTIEHDRLSSAGENIRTSTEPSVIAERRP